MFPSQLNRRFLTSFEITTRPSLRAAFARSLRLSIEGGTFPLPTLPIKDLKSFLGLVGKGSFSPSHYVSLRAVFVRNDDVDDFLPLGESPKGVSPSLRILKKAPRKSGGLRLSL